MTHIVRYGRARRPFQVVEGYQRCRSCPVERADCSCAEVFLRLTGDLCEHKSLRAVKNEEARS